ncbi:hypothetical protein EON64_00290 [archaeon]|nr:MAG: hypothetical protein EON64_00290 [archaeon]
MSFSWDQQGLPARLTREFQQRSQQRRAKTALQHIRGLGHKYEHILRSRQYRGLADIGGPSISLSLGRDDKAPRSVQEKHM